MSSNIKKGIVSAGRRKFALRTAITLQDHLTGNGADFAMVFKLENICRTDVGSKANDGGSGSGENIYTLTRPPG